MATQDDVVRIAMALPGAIRDEDDFAFAVMDKGKRRGFAGCWKERIHPKKARVPNLEVLALCVADQSDKQILISTSPEIYFTEPHYDGFPAILVRLANIEVEELAEMIEDAWRCRAPKALVEEYDRRQS